MKSEVVYAADGSMTGVRHAWTFDEMFSTFATQGIETKKKGVFTREELAPLAEVNVTSLKEFEYFNYAKVNGKKTPFKDPTDYWLEFKDSALTLNFMLPLQTPVKTKDVEVEIFDPSYFVDFSFAEKEPCGAGAGALGRPSASLQLRGPTMPRRRRASGLVNRSSINWVRAARSARNSPTRSQ